MHMRIDIDIDIDVQTDSDKDRANITNEVEGNLVAALRVLRDSGYDLTATLTTDQQIIDI